MDTVPMGYLGKAVESLWKFLSRELWGEHAGKFPRCARALRGDRQVVHAEETRDRATMVLKRAEKDEMGLVDRAFHRHVGVLVHLPVFHMKILTRIAPGHPTD